MFEVTFLVEFQLLRMTTAAYHPCNLSKGIDGWQVQKKLLSTGRSVHEQALECREELCIIQMMYVGALAHARGPDAPRNILACLCRDVQ